MTEPALDALTAALSDPTPEAIDALRSRLGSEVEVFAPFGIGTGVEAVEALVNHPTVKRVAKSVSWSEPTMSDDGLISVTGASPPNSPVGGFQVGVRLDNEGRITRIEQDLLPAAPADPAPLALTDEHRQLLDEALANGTPMLVAYVDEGGRPRLSYRATVQVLGADRLGMWIRDPNGGLLRALPVNPELSLFYSDRSKGITLQFWGRGRVDDDPAIRDTVYDRSPEVERTMDWRRRGKAVVIDVDRVEGRDSTGRVVMARR